MEKIVSGENHGSARTSLFGSFDSKSSLLLSEDRPDEMTDEVLRACRDRLQMSVKIINLENIMFERFSARVDPSILTYINQALNQHTTQSHSVPITPSHTSIIGRKNSIDSVSSHRTIGTKNWLTGSNVTRQSERMPKLSLQQKMDIIIRELELVATSIEKGKQKWKISRGQLLAQIEEATLRFEMACKSKEELELGFSHNWLDPVTGRVPAEKFVRFIKEQIHVTEGNIERHRLRTSTLLVHYARAKQQLLDKEELQEGLYPIDFEQHKICNAQLRKELEKKNQHLLELKQISGNCGLSLTEKKKNLWKVTQELNQLKECIEAKETTLAEMRSGADLVNSEIERAVDKLQKLKKVINEYHAPSVLEYIKKKAELDDLLRQKRLWSHRKNLQDLSYSVNKEH